MFVYALLFFDLSWLFRLSRGFFSCFDQIFILWMDILSFWIFLMNSKYLIYFLLKEKRKICTLVLNSINYIVGILNQKQKLHGSFGFPYKFSHL